MLSLLDWYLSLGCAMHWVRPRSKVPMETDWATKPVATREALLAAYCPGDNLGVRTGSWSCPQPGHGLLILDIDCKHPDWHSEPYEYLGRFAFPAAVPHVLSGSGLGQHWWVACPLDQLPPRANTILAQSQELVERAGKSALPAWTIEVLSTGKQVVVPPSTHPSGNRYRWMARPTLPLPILPPALLEALLPPPMPPSAPRMPQDHRVPQHGSVADAFRLVPWEIILEPHGWQKVGGVRGERQQWVRPGKAARDGISATTTDHVFYCFSSSTMFEAGMGYSKFAAYALLQHGGNMSEAAKRLASRRKIP